jgi:hypothetical protein
MKFSLRLHVSCYALALGAVLCLATLPAQAKRLALIMGNDNYQHVAKLKKAGNDAVAMATELRAAGFEVSLHRDLDYRNMVRATEALYSRIQGGDEVVVFFAGHGVQIKSGNFLLPTDIEATTESAVEKTSYSLTDLTDKLEVAKAAFSLILVDACRDNPLKTKGRAVGAERGLNPPDPPSGQMVVYSASRGEQALDRLSDDDTDPNSVFTREFISRMRKPGVRVEDIVRETQISVERLAASVGHKQRPAMYNEVRGNFYFYGPTTVILPGAVPGAAPGMDEAQREDRFWEDTKAAGNRDGFEAYLEQYPRGRYASLARANINRLGGGSPALNTAPSAAPLATPAPTAAAAVSPPVKEEKPAAPAAVSTVAPASQKPSTVATPSQGAPAPTASAADVPAPAFANPTSRRIALSNGDVYDGQVVGVTFNGVGSYVFANGDRYEGDFVKNEFHGKGTQTYASGDVYVGDFQHGIKTGKGSYQFANGNRYEGEFVGNEFQGQGVQTLQSGDRYEGEFVRGVKHGKGVYRFASGDRFEGSFIDNVFSGKGTMVFASGDRYEGDVVNGVKHGQGVHYFANKDRYVGGFVAGAQSGQGTHYYANGDKYEGSFANGVRHGKGVYRFASGEQRDLEYVSGVEKN